MAEYGRKGDKKVMYSRYDVHAVPTLVTTFFPNDNEYSAKLLKKKKSFKGKIGPHYSSGSNSALIRKIFQFAVEKILEKVAEGHIFVLPSSTEAYIALKPTPDEEVKYLRQNGYFADYDIRRARFKIPRFTFDFGPYNSYLKDVQIHVPKYIRDRAYENAQNGKIPYTTMTKRKRI